MAVKNHFKRDLSVPVGEGEFHRIPGIGPAIEQRLHAAGIQTFRQLASLTPEEILKPLAGLNWITVESINSQDWVGKADEFAKEIAAAAAPSDTENPGESQHYASFLVQLLQDENNMVRRTQVTHVQSGVKDGWAGWDIGRLDTWITGQAGIAAAASLPAPIPQEPAAPPQQSTAGDQSLVAEGRTEEGSEKPSSAAVAFVSSGDVKINMPGSDRFIRFLTAGQPFEIHIPIHFKAENRTKVPLLYRAAAYARSAGGQQVQVAETSGQFDTQGTNPLIIQTAGLEEGTYRLETIVLVYPEGAEHPDKEGQKAISEGGLVHVYSREGEPITNE